MKAVLSLTIVYFNGTLWQRWLSITGLTIIVLAVFNNERVVNSFPLQAVCFLASGAFFAGSALMPKIFGACARGHAIYLLPFGRLKLLTSAFLTTATVSLPLPIMSVLTARVSYSRILLTPNQDFLSALWQFVQLPFLWNLIANVFLFCTFMYVVLWFLTTSRTTTGKVLTLLIAIALLYVPPRFTSLNPDASIAPVVIAIAAAWTLFAAGFLLAPRWRQRFGRNVGQHLRDSLPWGFKSKFMPEKAMESIMGIAHPWVLASAIMLCIAFDTLFLKATGPWLFFLAILAIVTSAIAGLAATRSRTLWLRQPWSRDELFRHVEAFLWRQNAPSLVILIAWLGATGVYAPLDSATVSLGIPLILLSAATSFYLSLMQTRGLRWLDGMLAVAATLIIMAIAVLATERDGDLRVAVTLVLVLAMSTPLFRAVARRRWQRIDWLACRTLRIT